METENLTVVGGRVVGRGDTPYVGEDFGPADDDPDPDAFGWDVTEEELRHSREAPFVRTDAIEGLYNEWLIARAARHANPGRPNLVAEEQARLAAYQAAMEGSAREQG